MKVAKKTIERQRVVIQVQRAWWEESIEVPIIEAKEILVFPAKYIFNQRPKKGFPANNEEYIAFKTPNSVPSNAFPVGLYAIKSKDFKEILNTLPHFPNKKEGKRNRQMKAKKKQ